METDPNTRLNLRLFRAELLTFIEGFPFKGFYYPVRFDFNKSKIITREEQCTKLRKCVSISTFISTHWTLRPHLYTYTVTYFSYLEGPQSSFQRLIMNMNFKDISKTLPNVKEIINVKSRFGQFKRYIDQGKKYI